MRSAKEEGHAKEGEEAGALYDVAPTVLDLMVCCFVSQQISEQN